LDKVKENIVDNFDFDTVMEYEYLQ